MRTFMKFADEVTWKRAQQLNLAMGTSFSSDKGVAFCEAVYNSWSVFPFFCMVAHGKKKHAAPVAVLYN